MTKYIQSTLYMCVFEAAAESGGTFYLNDHSILVVSARLVYIPTCICIYIAKQQWRCIMQSENYVTLVKLQSRREASKKLLSMCLLLGAQDTLYILSSIVKYGTCDFTNRPKAPYHQLRERQQWFMTNRLSNNARSGMRDKYK